MSPIRFPRITSSSDSYKEYRRLMLEAIAERDNSDDPKSLISARSAVGCVLALDGNVISKSANVVPPKLKSRGGYNRYNLAEDDRYVLIEHAERAAILIAYQNRRSLDGATMYCTRTPCCDCARMILWAGIENLVVLSIEYANDPWVQSQKAGLRVLIEGGVSVSFFELGEDRSLLD